MNRLIGFIAGMLGGGPVAVILFVYLPWSTDIFPHLSNIWTVAAGGMIIGGMIGLMIPSLGERISRIWNYLP